MEAGLILRIECADETQCDFVFLMLDPTSDRPLDEDDVGVVQQKCYAALDEVEPANEVIEQTGTTTIQASWTLGGVDIEEDVQDIYGALKGCGVSDVFGILAGDDGWFELWVLKQGKLTRHDEWGGESLEDFIYAENDEVDEDYDDETENPEVEDDDEEGDEDDFFVVLDRIREQALSSNNT